MHEASVARILRRARGALLLAAAGLGLAACKGESGVGPDTPYPYDIVFERREGASGPPDIYLYSLETNEATRILAPSVGGMHPATSRIGSQVAFVRTDAEFNSEIFTITRGLGGVFGTLTNVSNSSEADVMPAWSPNGQRLAFVTDRDGFQDIFVANFDGTNLRRLTPPDPSPAVTTEWWPAWSPTGPLIAYSSSIEGTADIWTITVDAATVTRTLRTSGADTDLHPTWSPDGSRIAFHRIDQNTGESDIMILTLGTGALERITMPRQQLWPAWSPEGDLIAFSSNHEGDDFEIYTMATDGGDVVRRTDNGVNDLRPAWLIRPVE